PAGYQDIVRLLNHYQPFPWSTFVSRVTCFRLRAAQDAVRSALHGYRELPFMIESDGSKVIFNYRRYRWK
ncbi:MAG: hypothetical protein QHJ34_15785, partial [bacterium]|nr:hypothetical protein [bacterium]